MFGKFSIFVKMYYWNNLCVGGPHVGQPWCIQSYFSTNSRCDFHL